MPRYALIALLLGSLLIFACDPPREEAAGHAEVAPTATEAPTTPPNTPTPTPPADPTATPPDVAAPPADAERSPRGVAYKILEPGRGDAHPGPNDTVTVHYAGWTTDGKKFDASWDRNEPLTMPLYAVIPGWSDAMQSMKIGEKRRMWIPEELAYKGRPGFPAGMLVFDVTLLEIAKTPGTE